MDSCLYALDDNFNPTMLTVGQMLKFTGLVMFRPRPNEFEYKLSFYILRNGNRHGEMFRGGDDRRFYQDDVDITHDIAEHVTDSDNLSDEERVLIKLKWNIRCLPILPEHLYE